MKSLRIVMLALWLLALPSFAAPSFQEGVKALESGNDRKALSINQELPPSYGSFYNQGLAWRNLGDLPRARAAFEQALLYRPHDLATRRRLQEIERKLGDNVLKLDVGSTPWWSQSQAEILLLLPGLAMLFIGVRARRSRSSLPLGPTLAVWGSGLALAAFFILTAPPKHRAVVVDSTAKLLPGPSPDKPGEPIPGGVLVDVLEQKSHYLKIALADGKSGWLREAQLQSLAVTSGL